MTNETKDLDPCEIGGGVTDVCRGQETKIFNIQEDNGEIVQVRMPQDNSNSNTWEFSASEASTYTTGGIVMKNDDIVGINNEQPKMIIRKEAEQGLQFRDRPRNNFNLGSNFEDIVNSTPVQNIDNNNGNALEFTQTQGEWIMPYDDLQNTIKENTPLFKELGILDENDNFDDKKYHELINENIFNNENTKMVTIPNRTPNQLATTNILRKEAERMLDNGAKFYGYENSKDMVEKTKDDLQDLIITKDDLQELKVLDKPTDTATRLVWIFRTVAYEYSRGKKGCRIPLNEIGINGLTLRKQGDKERYKFEKDISKPLEQAGYTVNMMFNMELIGDCLEIVWG